MIEIIASVLMIGGTLFMIIATIGILRLPDLYTRMHSISKAGTVGAGLLLMGVAVHFGQLSFTTRAVAVILFILLTAPVASHIIGRAGYLAGVPVWGGSRFDQWGAAPDRDQSTTPSTPSREK
jgi:multicomponent Na+:H+ antiporter subunit G